jgi:alkanesulfonate monooxygenase SsuD/methylene tetrahydromethanopterin reductase-like flavin-dependent oxidoreductase (luciferase family)
VIPDATVGEVHEDMKQVIKDQIEHGVLADKHGYDRISFTEHHFEIVGAEFSPNPLLSQMMLAGQTDEIKLCQWANIITWHEPVRFAEQAAILDIVSDGRAEIGIGRGYQPRENEILGDQYWGGTIQDQEKNRAVFEEKHDIIEKAWSEEMFSYNGHYHHIPPKHTKWHHEQERLYLEDEVTDHEVEDMMDWKKADLYSQGLWNPVVSGGTTLEAVAVFPQPLQDPHPQLWQPVTSFRSVRWCARNGVNGVSFGDPRLEDKLDWYHEEAKKADWPDRLPEYDGEPFAYGWDEARQRGIAIGRWVFNTEVGNEATLERWKMGLEHGWDYFGPFGFTKAIKEDGGRVTAQDLIDADLAVVGDSDHIVEKLARIPEKTGSDGLHLAIFFESGGISAEECNAQLESFAEAVMPYLEEEYPSPN